MTVKKKKQIEETIETKQEAPKRKALKYVGSEDNRVYIAGRGIKVDEVLDSLCVAEWDELSKRSDFIIIEE